MPAISEDNASTECGDAESNCDIDDMLDEAMDDSGSVAYTEEGPTPPKTARRSAVSMGTTCGGASPTSSAASWEFTTPQTGPAKRVSLSILRSPLLTCGAKRQARLREQILGLGLGLGVLLLPETIAKLADMITSSDKM